MTDIIEQPKTNVILDATMLSSLMACPRYGDLRFNNRFDTIKGKSNSLETGSLAHKILEVFYQSRIDGKTRTESITKAMDAGQRYVTGCPYCCTSAMIGVEEGFKPECGHEPLEYPGLTSTPENNEKWSVGWRFVLDTMVQYFEHYKNDSFVPLSVEEVIREVLYEDEEIRVMWKAKFDLRIDMEQFGITSMDHKTFKQRRDKTKLSNQFIGQALLTKSRNVIINKIGFQTTLPIAERLSREVVSYSADHLNEWRTQILPYYAYKFIQYKESEYWPPNYTHCDTMFGPCMFKSVCESDRNMREEVLRNEFQLVPVWDPQNKDDE